MDLINIFDGRSFIEHRLNTGIEQPIRAIKQEYLLAGNGLFIRAKREEFTVCLPLSKLKVKGLPSVKTRIIWHYPQIPSRIFQEILENARISSDSLNFKEDVYVVFRQKTSGRWEWRNVSRGRTYASTIADDRQEEYAQAVLEIHTHPPGALHFSKLDDRDEEGKFRLFGIMIDIHSSTPMVRFRCGVYDHFVNISTEVIGEMPAGLIDLNLLAG